MSDEFTARQRAIALRLSGRSVKSICSALGRSEFWFYKWWRRSLESGAEGLFDFTRANHHVAQRIPPELERTILSIRRRLQAHAVPATRYSLIVADAIRAEPRALNVRPLPSRCTIERVLQRNGLIGQTAVHSSISRRVPLPVSVASFISRTWAMILTPRTGSKSGSGLPGLRELVLRMRFGPVLLTSRFPAS
jgi:transposase-like protein